MGLEWEEGLLQAVGYSPGFTVPSAGLSRAGALGGKARPNWGPGIEFARPRPSTLEVWEMRLPGEAKQISR